MSTSLFATSNAAGPIPLVEFRAGKMRVSEKSPNKFTVSPDLRKGVVKLFPKGADQMVHLTWSLRESKTAEDDLVLFPGDQIFEKVMHPHYYLLYSFHIGYLGRYKS